MTSVQNETKQTTETAQNTRTHTVKLDGEKLKKIGHANHTSEVIITALALRERLRHFSDITRLRNQLVRAGEKIVDEDYMVFWKSLEDAEVGSIVYGRKGKPDRFQWYVSMKLVAQAILEGKTEITATVEKRKPRKALAKVAKFAKRARIKTEEISKRRSVQPKLYPKSVFIALPGGFDLEIPVPPKGFSDSEVEAIGRALRRLSA